ncbi:amidohydrolase family protein [Monashia sp. NPDC004114]
MSLHELRLDTHLHLWDPTLGVYTWLTPDHGPLYAAFTPERAEAELRSARVDRAVLVQAADSAADTRAMLEVAQAHDWVAGVVGWVDLEDPGGAEAALAEWAASPAFCGIRQLVHDDPRDNMLGLTSVQQTLKILAAQGIPLDVPDAFPRQLEGARQAAQAVDDLVLVVDHLAKPPRGTKDLDAWERAVREVAQHENVVAKVSGLELAGQPWSADAVRSVWDIALDAFGTSRLMFGSDWPITVTGSGYAGTVMVLGELIGELSPDEQADLWWRTGSRTYRLGLDPA